MKVFFTFHVCSAGILSAPSRRGSSDASVRSLRAEAMVIDEAMVEVRPMALHVTLSLSSSSSSRSAQLGVRGVRGLSTLADDAYAVPATESARFMVRLGTWSSYSNSMASAKLLK
eukprot:CAMPEP_0195097090 /NCGR_PEP_ID=MMETSP0448-20130528/51932_1 /TAXON_ID=66468 /ORGANISM="Heterocapsa triquestra, Strain CCMP 448" /LENGTH=114 /DNA_ID=CAMNT_0040131557 /DNA_START=17 /DNA_END=361 /DNA_ORIENTATION=+